ncbi:MAG: hypothetical protein OWU84_00975 [Firmicutes bacterium]|nr:hypothetical protein [Bacillota bacterium]
MKRPVSLLLLLAFLAIQLYFARVPLTHQVQGSTWLEVSPSAGGMVERQGRYYLVAPNRLYGLEANGAHVIARPLPLSWVDVPEPSGAGVWKLAVGPSALPLVGLGGPVYPSPDGQSIVWVDPATRLGYLSTDSASGMTLISPDLSRIQRVLWAPDSQALGILGQGPEGFGAYLWDRDNNLTPMAIPSDGLTITGMGFSQDNLLLVALSTGQVLYQGRGVVALPRLSPLFLDPDQAAILGETRRQVIFWRPGARAVYERPDASWEGRAMFAANGQTAAILGQNHRGAWELFIYGTSSHEAVRLPFSSRITYDLLGFLGSHWVLVSVPDGPHRGTYAWWVQAP